MDADRLGDEKPECSSCPSAMSDGLRRDSALPGHDVALVMDDSSRASVSNQGVCGLDGEWCPNLCISRIWCQGAALLTMLGAAKLTT
jgi:hypothetical protein